MSDGVPFRSDMKRVARLRRCLWLSFQRAGLFGCAHTHTHAVQVKCAAAAAVACSLIGDPGLREAGTAEVEDEDDDSKKAKTQEEIDTVRGSRASMSLNPIGKKGRGARNQAHR